MEAPRLTACHLSAKILSAPGARVIFRFFWEASRPGLEFFFLCRVLVATLHQRVGRSKESSRACTTKQRLFRSFRATALKTSGRFERYLLHQHDELNHEIHARFVQRRELIFGRKSGDGEFRAADGLQSKLSMWQCVIFF